MYVGFGFRFIGVLFLYVVELARVQASSKHNRTGPLYAVAAPGGSSLLIRLVSGLRLVADSGLVGLLPIEVGEDQLKDV